MHTQPARVSSSAKYWSRTFWEPEHNERHLLGLCDLVSGLDNIDRAQAADYEFPAALNHLPQVLLIIERAVGQKVITLRAFRKVRTPAGRGAKASAARDESRKSEDLGVGQSIDGFHADAPMSSGGLPARLSATPQRSGPERSRLHGVAGRLRPGARPRATLDGKTGVVR